MKLRTIRWAQVSPRLPLLMHTVRAARGRGKRPAGQLAKSPCQRATQVILRVRVVTRKARAATPEQCLDGSDRCAPSKQLFGDPLIGNAPIGVRESLWNPQPLQPVLVDGGGRREGTGCGDHQFAGERNWQRSARGDGAGAALHLLFSGLYEQSTMGGQTNLRMQESHPGSVPVTLPPEGLLVGEPGQASQMAPVGARQVTPVGVGQLSGDSGGGSRFQAPALT